MGFWAVLLYMTLNSNSTSVYQGVNDGKILSWVAEWSFKSNRPHKILVSFVSQVLQSCFVPVTCKCASRSQFLHEAVLLSLFFFVRLSVEVAICLFLCSSINWWFLNVLQLKHCELSLKTLKLWPRDRPLLIHV